MTRTRRRRLMLVGCLLLGLSAAAALMLTAFKQDMLYFHEPSAIAAGTVPINTRFRIGGLVKMGSVSRPGDGMTVHFAIADCDASVPVTYSGTLPDLFRQGQGVIAYGKLDAQGTFVADRILAKHDSNYMSSDTARALKAKTSVSCMPSRLQASR
ncbi:cytochrome c maturation protein CcmE [Salinisphaera sp. Q1T1-3]|uniref:cytochrome c maturation protein CcmE n=1 Tax=Salinisphaera sp. Q1T1-3 TaxID=2321229 RepID=UPI000E70F6C9|nr:cytochrome c maturation protein CcmE [Salinisphaera sp. Q1T1-3]RJS92072.1 cytochrome c maturation protein CcmE [Salinisphaera sp. Q1T1-3]